MENQDEEQKSKSQLKREMHDLQALGETLVKLPLEQLKKIPLPENLHEAILLARSIEQRGALKRQLQYIGKLMREVEADPIREKLDSFQGQSRQATQTLHSIERWREQLLEQGDGALQTLLSQYPQADRQYLRQLIRNAKKETAANKPPKSARSLFRYLRELIDSES